MERTISSSEYSTSKLSENSNCSALAVSVPQISSMIGVKHWPLKQLRSERRASLAKGYVGRPAWRGSQLNGEKPASVARSRFVANRLVEVGEVLSELMTKRNGRK